MAIAAIRNVGRLIIGFPKWISEHMNYEWLTTAMA